MDVDDEEVEELEELEEVEMVEDELETPDEEVEGTLELDD